MSFLLVGHQLPNRMDVGYEGPLAEALIRIGPARASVVEWPPRSMMDQDLIEGITPPPSGFQATVRPA